MSALLLGVNDTVQNFLQMETKFCCRYIKKQISLSRLFSPFRLIYYFISERKCLGKQFLYDAGDNAAVGLASHLL